MLPQNNPDRIRVVFDDHRLVANAGLLLPATLAQHLGLRELVGHHLDLGCAPGRANTGDKLLTLVASALAGGDFIDDADALRAGGTVGVLGCVVKAPSTLGTFPRSFRWGHVRQLDRVSRQLLARAWAAGAGPCDSPLTIDLDSTICETYGLDKEGARDHNYTGARGYHPLLAIAAGTGDVLMSRLREGRANTARGAAHFLRETVGRVRCGGASGQLTVRADSGFYAHALVAVCREMGVCFSITIRQHKGLRELIEAIPEQDWTPIPYWMDGAADVAETTYTPFQSEPGAAPVRLIVRRVKPTPGSCRCSMIMSVSNCSMKMSVYERTDVDYEGADEDTGVERSDRGQGDGGGGVWADGSERAPCVATTGSIQRGRTCCRGSREQGQEARDHHVPADTREGEGAG